MASASGDTTTTTGDGDGAVDVQSMSVKELKALIKRAGLSFQDCFEKADLRTRAKEAAQKLAAAPPPSSSDTSCKE